MKIFVVSQFSIQFPSKNKGQEDSSAVWGKNYRDCNNTLGSYNVLISGVVRTYILFEVSEYWWYTFAQKIGKGGGEFFILV